MTEFMRISENVFHENEGPAVSQDIKDRLEQTEVHYGESVTSVDAEGNPQTHRSMRINLSESPIQEEINNIERELTNRADAIRRMLDKEGKPKPGYHAKVKAHADAISRLQDEAESVAAAGHSMGATRMSNVDPALVGAESMTGPRLSDHENSRAAMAGQNVPAPTLEEIASDPDYPDHMREKARRLNARYAR